MGLFLHWYIWSFFYGAAAKGKGGVGVFLGISNARSFHIKLGCGLSTNTSAELLALWTLLYWAKVLGLLFLHIFGDSSVIINWAIGKAALACLALDNWCEAIRQMMPNFLSVDLQHVYREHNQMQMASPKRPWFWTRAFVISLLSEFYDDSVI